ncbi:hypothetical protein AGDE_15464 [Angomonas deanei]|uniref:Uncharacterized protein n=1 Tax=Angomonas deanei TaxID=59799 RepID=A0A7G2CU55_9TRYP|nr:hypothetical protein AGDE_15464 [Angomonas deanei]CAD2222601.1 hypothetical protein, conserved [Angomonas deanei]|eukprot:EPY19015.1 hypothetical protein AGDE_15464 [Angomonas deanei]
MLEGAPVTTGGSRAMGWVEEEVRRVLTEQGETLAEAHDGVVSYFLKKESQLPESLRQAVWNPLLSSSTELAAMVIQDGEMHQLGRTFLTIRESYFNRRSIAFVGALLSQVADHNPLLALTILQDDVLTGEVIASLGRHLHYINAEYIATLMQSVVVTFSYVADPHVLLRRLLGHLQEVTSRGTLSVPVPKCVLLLLLRALLQRVCKRCSFTILDVSNNNNNNNNSGDKSVVYRELFDFSLDHACDGLSSESPKTRLAGAALAAAILLSDDVPLLQVVDATLLLIFPESEAQRGMDVSFDVVRNTYLCAALRRVRLQLSAKGESEALPLYRALFAALQDHLVQRICPLLSTAGNAKMKAVVAAELGAVVGVLDDEVAAEVGACVLRFILTKLPPDALSSVLDPEDQSGTTVVQPLLGVYSFADLLRSFPPVLLCACILQHYQVEEVTDLTPAVRDAVHWMFIAMVVVNGTRSLLTTESEEELDRWRTLLATFNNCVVPVYQSSDDNDDDGDSVAELNASIDKIYQTFSSYWPEEEEEDSNAEEERTELERALVWYRNVFG